MMGNQVRRSCLVSLAVCDLWGEKAKASRILGLMLAVLEDFVDSSVFGSIACFPLRCFEARDGERVLVLSTTKGPGLGVSENVTARLRSGV